MPETIKTIKLRLYTDQEQAEAFAVLSEQYRQACNFVSEYVFSHNFEMNSNKLSKALYHNIRSMFGLKSQLAQSVFRTVTARYKTLQEQLWQKPFRYKDENGKWQRITRTLEWTEKPIYFKRPQADLVRDRDYSFVNDGTMLSLNTLGKRAKVRFAGEHFAEYLDSQHWSLGTGKLVKLKGIWYFHIPATRIFASEEEMEAAEFRKESIQHVVGIDRGLRFLAVAYDEQGKTEFVSGKQILRKRRKYRKLRNELQSKNTKSAKRVLKRLSGRENRWMADVNHRVTKTLVERYGPNTLFVLEDLTGVSFAEQNLHENKNQNADLSSWSFYQFERFLDYKANANCSKVLKVDPQFTSQRCPKCGTILKENRDHEHHEYHCQCGYRSNDDRVGAMNIQLLGTLWVSGEENPKFVKQ